MKFDAALTESLHQQLCDDLLKYVRTDTAQEELRFALWRPATGATRKTALVFEIIEPKAGERELHGNASFDSSYLSRAVQIACKKKAGVAFMHNHLSPGWQSMSEPDVIAERDRISPPARATELPLLGMTLGTDGSWSARVWEWDGKKFNRRWCDKVRVVGKRLGLTFNDHTMPPTKRQPILQRTVDTWGMKCQNNLARLRIGIIGAGSVGGMVAETLARMGIQNLLIVDPDRVEIHNLDRLLHATQNDIGKHKASLSAERLRNCATAESFKVDSCTLPAQHEKALGKILDCDLLFSAVDRPLPKDLLNRIAYTHCIPVVSGGVYIDNKSDGSLGQAAWSAASIAPGRRCLRCDGQYTSSEVMMEKDGSLDDPAYIQGLVEQGQAQSNQNVFPFSANLASCMVIEMVRLVIAADWWPDSGGKIHYSLIPNQLATEQESCGENCSIQESTTQGDAWSYPFILADTANRKQSRCKRFFGIIRHWFHCTPLKRGSHGKNH